MAQHPPASSVGSSPAAIIAPAVVALSFRTMVNGGYLTPKALKKLIKDGPAKKDKPALTIEMLGHIHTLRAAGNALFDHYLGDLLKEGLESHLWRFEPVGTLGDDPDEEDSDHDPDDEDEDFYGMALNHKLPVLSSAMAAKSQFSKDADIRFPLKVGSILKFCYDEGSPTSMLVMVDAIRPLGDASIDPAHFPPDASDVSGPPGVRVVTVRGVPAPAAATTEGDVPRPAKTPKTAGAADATTAPGGAAILDSVFPLYSAAAMNRRYPAAFFGRCVDDARCQYNGGIEPGARDNGDQLWAPHEFDNLEDFLIAAEHFWPRQDAEKIDALGMRDGWQGLVLFPHGEMSEKVETKVAKCKKQFERLERVWQSDMGMIKPEDPRYEEKTEDDFYQMCGPARVFCRLTAEQVQEGRAALRARGFNLETVFPALYKATVSSNGKKRIWFAKRGDLLVVASGMKDGTDTREPKVLLAEVNGPFSSMHALFAAADHALQTTTLK